MHHTLELCAGTGSFSRACTVSGSTPITVDIDPSFQPTHVCDVRQFDYTRLYPDKKTFRYIWCSPPCTHYSNAKRSGIRDYNEADSIVRRCLEIIDNYDCELWFIENPSTGYLKTRPCMNGRPYHVVDYCAYEDSGRKKATAIWTNHATFVPRRCAGVGKCPSMVGTRHRATCTGSYWDPTWKSKRGRAIECARVPLALVDDLLCASASNFPCMVVHTHTHTHNANTKPQATQDDCQAVQPHTPKANPSVAEEVVARS